MKKPTSFTELLSARRAVLAVLIGLIVLTLILAVCLSAGWYLLILLVQTVFALILEIGFRRSEMTLWFSTYPRTAAKAQRYRSLRKLICAAALSRGDKAVCQNVSVGRLIVTLCVFTDVITPFIFAFVHVAELLA